MLHVLSVLNFLVFLQRGKYPFPDYFDHTIALSFSFTLGEKICSVALKSHLRIS